jgi:hypothetical protein
MTPWRIKSEHAGTDLFIGVKINLFRFPVYDLKVEDSHLHRKIKTLSIEVRPEN